MADIPAEDALGQTEEPRGISGGVHGVAPGQLPHQLTPATIGPARDRHPLVIKSSSSDGDRFKAVAVMSTGGLSIAGCARERSPSLTAQYVTP